MDGSARMRKAAAFLTRLRRDARGNVLALVAASLVPLIGLAGGSVDLSRLYLSKVRLQHACDAGALAGRKAMGAGGWDQTNPSPEVTADQFFAGNFVQGSYGTTTLTHKYTGADGIVNGTASVAVPMAMMGFFGIKPQTVSVTCQAKVQIPNTDVMFVLDVTGSMADKANSGDSQNKITTLKYAVKCFYESLTQLTTNAGCPSGTSTGAGISAQSQVRFGFVPYNTNVNVAALLPSNWFADSWKYQSRNPRWGIFKQKGDPQTGAPIPVNAKQDQCTDSNAATFNSSSDTENNEQTILYHTDMTYKTAGYSNGTCYVTQTQTTTTYDIKENVTPGSNDRFADWHYGQITENISALKNGTGWKSSFSLPIGSKGTARTVSWDGCIEERATVRAANYDPIPSGARDLDIDGAATQGDAGSLWAPALPGLIYTRKQGHSNWQMAELYDMADYPQGLDAVYYCPTAAKKLQVWSDPGPFDNYVDSLQPNGNTYHDIGMLWGGRFLSPTGIFKSENEKTPSGGTIQRYMIFMTDGDTYTTDYNYNAYGLAWFDRRQTDVNVAPDSNALNQQVNLRFAALCTAVKNKGIGLYVVSFGGTGITTDTKQRLQACATDATHYYDATSADQLKAAFASIAAQITQLRLVQ